MAGCSISMAESLISMADGRTSLPAANIIHAQVDVVAPYNGSSSDDTLHKLEMLYNKCHKLILDYIY